MVQTKLSRVGQSCQSSTYRSLSWTTVDGTPDDICPGLAERRSPVQAAPGVAAAADRRPREAADGATLDLQLRLPGAPAEGLRRATSHAWRATSTCQAVLNK